MKNTKPLLSPFLKLIPQSSLLHFNGRYRNFRVIINAWSSVQKYILGEYYKSRVEDLVKLAPNRYGNSKNKELVSAIPQARKNSLIYFF